MNPTLAYLLLTAQTLAWLLWLWHRRPQQDTDDNSPLLLLYASQGGQAETLAQTLAPQLGVTAHSLDAWHAHHPVKALNHKTLILIASTTGDGDPPDNAIRFSRSLKKTGAALTDTRYHLLALGDKRYPHYCAYGYHLDSELQRLGAVRESPVTTVDNLDPQTIAYWQKQLGEHLHTALNALGIPHTHRPDACRQQAVYQFLCFYPESRDELAGSLQPDMMKIIRWHPSGTDWLDKTASKARGIQTALQQLGLKMADAMAFGDAHNDMEMLQTVGFSVAMGNAVPEIKAIADYVCPPIDEDGIYRGLVDLGIL